VSTLVGDPYQEARATEGADVSILSTSNWTKVSSEHVSNCLEEKFLRDLKESAKDHREVAMRENLPKTATSSDASSKPTFLSKAVKFIAPWKKLSSTKSGVSTPKLDEDSKH